MPLASIMEMTTPARLVRARGTLAAAALLALVVAAHAQTGSTSSPTLNYGGSRKTSAAISALASKPAANVAKGPQLTFEPGVVNQYMRGADYPSPGIPSSTSSTAFSSGNSFQFGFGLDSADNVYIATDGLNAIFAAASGKGPMPGISNPVAGLTYDVGGQIYMPCADASSAGCGDGYPALKAYFDCPIDAKVDSQGNIYVVDACDNVVRRIDAKTTIVTTVAGSYTAGYTGDGGAATNATLQVPYGMAFDSADNYYISDLFNLVVRRVDAKTGIITTAVGGGTSLADGSPAAQTDAGLPWLPYVDSDGNLYYYDTVNFILRVVYAGGTVPGLPANPVPGSVYTVAGTPGVMCTVLPCGDGGPATQATLGYYATVERAPSGDLYVSDSNDNVVRKIDTSGTISTIAGVMSFNVSGGDSCSPPYYGGDGGLASAALFDNITESHFASDGSLYIGDTYGCFASEMRLLTAATSAYDFGAQPLGSTSTQKFQMINTGDQPLDLTVLAFAGTFSQQLTAGTDCQPGESLAPGESCGMTVAFTPYVTAQSPGSVAVSSNSANAADGQNIITLTGSGQSAGGVTAQTITFPALPNVTYGVLPITLSAEASSKLPVTAYLVSGPARLSGQQLVITGAGTVAVTAYQFGNTTYAPATSVTQSFTAAPAPLTVTANNLSRQYGQPNPALTYSVNGLTNGDTQAVLSGTPAIATTATQTSDAGKYTISISSGTFSAGANYSPTFVGGTLTITGEAAQQITFPALPGVTYGVAPITLSATATPSGLPVAYTSNGPATISGSTLTVDGAGSVTVTAHEDGNADYAAAAAVSESFTVAPAQLTVTAASLSRAYNTPNALSYSVKGFVDGDTQAVVSGAPVLTTMATQTSPPGAYPISIMAGTLLATNYTFALAGGTLTVLPDAQSITLPRLPAIAYGAAPFLIAGTATSGLPVTYSVTGPATISGAILTVTGAGPVVVTATQPGNSDYVAAPPATASFTVNRALVTVAAENTSRQVGSADPAFAYTLSGFVNGDTKAVVSGAPLLTTTATSSSPKGAYPIVIAAGTLAANNYTFGLVNGTLTVTAESQTISFPTSGDTAYGSGPVSLTATSSSGLPVTYVVSGPAALTGSTLRISGAGLVTVIASQAGNQQYAAAAAVARTFTVAPAPLTVTAANVSRPFGDANPSLTYSIAGFVDGDAQSVVAGTPSLATTAGADSPAGTYPILAGNGTLSAANYAFSFVNGTLTVEAGAISLGPASGGSTSATVSAGGNATYNLELTANGFVGTVKLACSGAPSQSTCSVSPALVAFSDTVQASPYAVTVETTAAGSASSAANCPPKMPESMPGAPIGFPISLGVVGLIGWAGGRRSWQRRLIGCVAAVALMQVLNACGGSSSGSSSQSLATPVGTYQLTVTASSSTVSPNQNATQTLTLIVQ